jgi:hypothetical protein
MTKKTAKGQLQVLPIVFAILATTALAVNITMNQTSTGLVTIHKTIEETASIEIWANTTIEIINQGYIKALLLLDNKTALYDQEIEFYLDNLSIGKVLTNTEGYAIININSSGVIKAVFTGNDNIYLNPSYSEREIKVVEEIPDKTDASNTTEENITVDNTAPRYSLLGANNTNPKKGDTVEFQAFWEDDFSLDKWIFSWNYSGSWQNETYDFVSSYVKGTQLLTSSGWKSFENLDYEDRIATLNNGKIEWKNPLKIITRSYEGDIYKIDGNVELFVTSGHKIYARIDNLADRIARSIEGLVSGLKIEDFEFIDIESLRNIP